MTREEWELAPLDRLFEALEGRASDRKWRLFACACAHTLSRLEIGAGGRALALAERFADGRATAHELASARFGLAKTRRGAGFLCWAPHENARELAFRASNQVLGTSYTESGNSRPLSFAQFAERTQRAHADLLREIVAWPFEPMCLEASWLDRDGGQLRQLAEVAYESRDWELLPILADVLEESGCQEARLLAHLRRAGGHCRGCYALDLLVGRE